MGSASLLVAVGVACIVIGILAVIRLDRIGNEIRALRAILERAFPEPEEKAPAPEALPKSKMVRAPQEAREEERPASPTRPAKPVPVRKGICPRCGEALRKDAEECLSCGADVRASMSD